MNNYLDLSIKEINKLLKEKKILPIDLVNEAIDRIEKNSDLNCFITLNKEEALKCAKELENKDTELKRYLYVIAPKCQPNSGTPLITHQDLVYNAGMNKEKFLDIDKKSYCKAYIKAKCVEVGKWDWDIMISCKNYTDDGYVDWNEEFESTN